MTGKIIMKNDKFTGSQKSRKRNLKVFEHWQIIAMFLIIYDLTVVVGSYFMALWLRFDCHFSEIPSEYLTAWLKFSPIYAAISVFVFNDKDGTSKRTVFSSKE